LFLIKLSFILLRSRSRKETRQIDGTVTQCGSGFNGFDRGIEHGQILKNDAK
jgi:hypothetical protein